jgi:outer membrane protein
MRRNGLIWVFGATLACATAATPAGAQQLSDARIHELMKQAATRIAMGSADVRQPAPSSATKPVVALTLDDAVKFALDRNLDIAVQRLNPEINDISVAKIRSVYKPLLTSTISGAGLTQLPTTQLIGGANVVQDTQTINGGLTQSIPWGGGSLSVALNNFRQTSTSSNVLYNPTIQQIWTGVYTQPLLRGFQTDTNRQQIGVTRINRDISDVQLRSTITNTVSNVREAYWNYVYSVQAVDVAQQSVTLADQLVKDNQTRVEVGTMAPIDVVTAQSQAAAAVQNLVTAQGAARTAELALKRLIVGGELDPNWSVTLNPVDRPDFHPEPIDLEGAIKRALSERTDLEIAKKNGQGNDITMKYLKDQLKPQADLQATYGLGGLGGVQCIRSGTVLGGACSSIVEGGTGDAFSSLFTNAYPRWTVQLNFSYPLGYSGQEASVARARVQQNQIQAQVKQIELQVATDVTNAAINVESGVERVQAAQAARELAQKTMEAEQSKFEVGMSTNYNVILTQRDLATAQINELQAILNYRIALVELERLQQTTLTSLNISILSPQ